MLLPKIAMALKEGEVNLRSWILGRPDAIQRIDDGQPDGTTQGLGIFLRCSRLECPVRVFPDECTFEVRNIAALVLVEVLFDRR